LKLLPPPPKRGSLKRQRSASSHNEAAAAPATAAEEERGDAAAEDPPERGKSRNRSRGRSRSRGRKRRYKTPLPPAPCAESTSSLDASDEEYGVALRTARSPHPGVSFVTKRREYQGQITLSMKLHVGNYKSANHAAYAVAQAKARLLALGWTVKLADPEVAPSLNAHERKKVDERAGAAMTNFERRCLTSFVAAAPGVGHSRPIAVQCASSADACVACGTHVFSCLAALQGAAVVLLRPRAGGWEMQRSAAAAWTPLDVGAYCEVLEAHDVVTVRG
jgi:hypothetical protein